MSEPNTTLSGKRLTTPKAAAFAGILFSLLFTASIVLIRISLPTGPMDQAVWQGNEARLINIALSMMPFAGIAFLWFMGVVRDRLGAYEDQFFSTVFFGSGLIFLAMVFSASAIAGGIAINFVINPEEYTNTDVFRFGRVVMSQLFTIYALRMAGVFVISLGTIWLRTGVMPRWLTVITYLFAVILLLSTTLSIWMVLVFPTWVFIVSIFILILNLRRKQDGSTNGLSVSLPNNP